MKIMSTDVIEHVTQEDESTAEVVILSQVEEKEHDKKLMRFDSLDIESANVADTTTAAAAPWFAIMFFSSILRWILVVACKR